MAQSVTSPIVLGEPVRSGDELLAADVLEAYTAAQCAYEEVIGAIVIDSLRAREQLPSGAASLDTGDKLEYRLKAPRGEGTTTAIMVLWATCKAVGGANAVVEVNGVEYEIDDTSPWLYGVGDTFTVDDDDTFDLVFEVINKADGIYIYDVFAIAVRSRTAIPEGDLANGVHGVDLARIAADNPLSVARHNDVLSMLRATHAQQYRSAIACAAWQTSESAVGLFAGSDAQVVETGLEVPDSSTQRTATLTVRAMAADVLGFVDVAVNGESKRITCTLALTWYEESWTVDLPRAGISRPYRVPFSVEASVDVPIVGLCAEWSEVMP